MTGFGAAEVSSEATAVSVIMRSLNHRHLDLRLHLPEELRGVEEQWATMIRNGVQRGRIEVTVKVENLDQSREIVVDRELVRTVVDEFSTLEKLGLASGGITGGDLLNWPPALRVERVEPDSQATTAMITDCLAQAFAALVSAREHEGARLKGFLEERLVKVESIADQLRERRAMVEGAMREDYRQRLVDLGAPETLGEERIALEVSAAIDKSSITEETDRLAAHCEHFQSVVEADGATGRKLDFIVQEIFREFNTIAAKCRDTESVHAAIEGKTLCEDLREQLRNVE